LEKFDLVWFYSAMAAYLGIRLPVSGQIGGLIELRHSWAIVLVVEINSKLDIDSKYKDAVLTLLS
jgi:hypothetical protein